VRSGRQVENREQKAHNKQTMKQTLTILLFILGSCLLSQRIYSQQYKLIGSDICSDGTQSTHISLSDSDPLKFYALYRDGELTEVKKHNSKKTPNVLDFGNYSEPGKYTAVEFSGANPEFEKPEKGRKINGSVNINKVPVLYVAKKFETRSGSPLNYQPKASIEGCTFKWTARLDAGNATGFKKSGAGLMITDTIVVQGKQLASVVYTIIPYSPDHLGSCMGNNQELVVWIKP
jgi:hypothetical protein